MTCAARRNYLFRTFAGAVACVFFVHEMSFAGDVIDSALDRLALEQSQTFAPDYLGERQSFNENVVDEKQALEDLSAARYPAPGAEDQADEGGMELQGPKVGSPAGFQAQQGSLSGEDAQASGSSVFNITTQAGDVIHYINGVIDRVEQADGTVIRDLILGGEARLIGARIEYPDGTVQIAEGGIIARSIMPDGSVVDYSEGGDIESVLYADGSAVTYSYIKEDSGAVVETVLAGSDGVVSRYGADGRLFRSERPDGTVFEYDSGVLCSIKRPGAGAFIFGQVVEDTDGQPLTKVALSRYVDADGNTYYYKGGRVTSVRVLQNGILYNASVDPDGRVETGNITLQDGTNVVISRSAVVNATLSGGSRATYLYPAPGVIVADLIDTGKIWHCVLEGDNWKLTDPSGMVTEYTRGYDMSGDPSRLTMKSPGKAPVTYLYNGISTLTALEALNIRYAGYFKSYPSVSLSLQNMSSGTLAVDGKYLYIRSLPQPGGAGVITRIGTGYGGTVKGRNYGTLAAVGYGSSMACHSDGFIYSTTADPDVLEKIDAVSGAKTRITPAGGLLGVMNTQSEGRHLLTSDGRYVYNAVSYTGDGSSGSFDGWTVRVFDPRDDWRVVRTCTVRNPSYRTSGVFSDGIFMYFIEARGPRVTASRISDASVTAVYTGHCLNGRMTGQYDWVNNKYWLGSNTGGRIYAYNALVTPVGYGPLEANALFARPARLVQVTDVLKASRQVEIPSDEFIRSNSVYSELVYGPDKGLLSVKRHDGASLTLSGGAVSSAAGAGGDAADYSYEYSELDTVLEVGVLRDGIKRFYDVAGRLKKIITSDETAVNYEQGSVSSVEYKDGTRLIYRGGRIEEAVDSDGTSFTLDSGGRPVTAVDRYGNIYRYSYGTDTLSGKETVVIDDESAGGKRFYEGGLLVRAENAEGCVSENYYDSDGRLERAVVSRLGRVIDVYLYCYKAPGETEVSDSGGNVRTYGEDGRLRGLKDASGNVYSYSYPDSVTVRMELSGYAGPRTGELVVGQEFVNNILRKIYRADGTCAFLTVEGRIDHVSDIDGRITVDYRYDDEGGLSGITFCGARRDLERSVIDAENKVEEERARSLAALAEQRGMVIGQINNQVAPDLNSLISQRDSLRAQWNSLNSQDVGWWDPFGTARREKSRRLDELGGVICGVEQALSQIYAQLSSAYAQVDAEVAALKSDIDRRSDEALSGVAEQRRSLELDIARQEAAAFVLYCYRDVLGRDPDRHEIGAWTGMISESRQRLERAEVAAALAGSQEYADIYACVSRIKSRVRELLLSYVNDMTDGGRQAFLSSLGLDPADVVGLPASDAGRILEFIDSQGFHFGQSAFRALGALFLENGIEADFEESAASLIMIDILSGVTDVFTKGDLVISAFAMSRYAASRGLALYGARFSYDEMADAAGSSSIIAHVDGNHYIVITGADGDTVRYRETNRGPSGSEEAISKRDFMERWSGYVITASEPADQSTIITADEAKKVRGAFFPLLAPLISAIAGAVTSIVTGIISAVGTVVAAVAGIVATALANVTGFIASAGTLLISSIGSVFTGIGGALGGFFGSSLLGAAVKTVAGIGLSFGIQTGLQAMGVNSSVANLTAAFLTGGVLGIIDPLKNVGALGSFMSGAMKYATMSGINELAPKLDLAPALGGILSMTAGALVDGLWQGSLGGTIVKIAPNVAGEFAYYGVSEILSDLGIDPRISYLAGIGIRSGTVIASNGVIQPGALWDGIINGLLRGSTSMGLQWAYDALDMDPLLGALSAAAVTGGIEGMLEGQNALQGVSDTLFKSGRGLLTLGGTGEDAWSRAAYVAQLLNFSQIINEMGIVEALETYASGFLHQSAIENIWKMGGIADLVINKAEVALNEEGEVVKRVYINNERTDFIDFSLDMDDMVGYKQGNILVDCHIQIGPDGRPTTDNGKIKVSLEDKSRIVYHIKDYDLVLIEYIDAGGKTIAFASPLDGEKSIKMNDDNNLIRTGKFFNREKQVIVYKRDNTVFRVISTPRSDMTDAELQELFDHRLEAEYLDGVVIDYDKDSGDVKIELDPDALRVGEFEGKTSYLTLISANGVSNELGEYTAPAYEEVLRYRLSDNGIDQNTIYLLPMFEGKNPVRDIAMWFLDNAGVNILTSELMAKLDREIYGDIMPGQQYEPKVMVLYSGSANSFFKAINRRHDYNIRDALILGGPTLDGIFEDTVITNPNIDRVFNVWGTKDILGPVISNKRYSANVEAYNIEIIGASHCDYFYQISSGELGARASYFIEELITTAYGNSNIQYLFEKHHVVYDSGRNVYIVDPNQIDYEG